MLRAARRRPLRDAALIVALTPVIAVVVAAAMATVAMFLSTEQFGVLITLVVFAGRRRFGDGDGVGAHDHGR